MAGAAAGATISRCKIAGIVLTVVGLVLGALGGLWLKHESDDAERQKAINNGHSYNDLNVMAAGCVLGMGVVGVCIGLPLLLTHL